MVAELGRLQKGCSPEATSGSRGCTRFISSRFSRPMPSFPIPIPMPPRCRRTSAGRRAGNAGAAGPAGFILRMERLPDNAQAHRGRRSRLRSPASSPNCPRPSAAGRTPTAADDIRLTAGWIVKNVAGPYQRYRLLSAVVSGGGEDAVVDQGRQSDRRSRRGHLPHRRCAGHRHVPVHPHHAARAPRRQSSSPSTTARPARR